MPGAFSLRCNNSTTRFPARIHVVDPATPGTVYIVRRCDIVCLPYPVAQALDALRKDGALRMCSSFASQRLCPHGPDCAFAHIHITERTTRLACHRVPADGWAGDSAVPPRGAGPAIVVEAPNRPGEALETIDPAACLHTTAFEGFDPCGSDQMSHCAHWLMKGVCHYGAACKFVHALHPTPQAIASVAGRDTMRRSANTASRDDAPIESGSSLAAWPRSASSDASNYRVRRPARTVTTDRASAAPQRTYPFVHRPYAALPL